MAERIEPLPLDLIWAYYVALQQLSEEGNENAIETIRQMELPPHLLNAREWATNIHYNDWPITNFAATVKARVVKNRMKT